MPAVIDATVGGANANAYATVAEADAYHETHLYASAWENADADQKVRALIMATRLLDERVTWDGAAATYTQRLAWPRWGVYDLVGNAIDPATLPDALKNATAEFARLLIEKDRTAEPDVDTEGLAALKAGPVTLTFKDEPIGTKVVPDSVWSMIALWGSVDERSTDFMVPLVRT